MAIWFTSDPHIGHRLVSGLRGFWRLDRDGVRDPDTDAHDATLGANWDRVVDVNDTVYILGDMSINSGRQVTPWVDARPGNKILISGNHDKTHTRIFPSKNQYVRHLWSESFVSIQDELVIEIDGKKVILSHFPFWSWGDGPRAGSGDPNFKPRYEEMRPKETKDAILIHGHTHTPEKEHERSYHVGLDAHRLQLVPESQIIDWIRTLD